MAALGPVRSTGHYLRCAWLGTPDADNDVVTRKPIICPNKHYRAPRLSHRTPQDVFQQKGPEPRRPDSAPENRQDRLPGVLGKVRPGPPITAKFTFAHDPHRSRLSRKKSPVSPPQTPICTFFPGNAGVLRILSPPLPVLANSRLGSEHSELCPFAFRRFSLRRWLETTTFR